MGNMEKTIMGKKRIFWLGMHKVLVRTELPALRDIGYEVFNPPYLSNVQDQSAELDWIPSETTLPERIHERLTAYNFFYNYIDGEISEILNDYFDAIIVTINPDWLVSILKVFKKTVIYRTYGGIGILSDSLLMNGGYKLIQEHDDFWFLPHCAETASDEHNWLRDKIKISPYWLTDDVFFLRGQWQNKWPKKPEIGLTCPNVSNPYYQAHFNYLKAYFEQRCFRYYGTQIEVNADPNIVGTLPRDQYLEEFLSLSGYLYTYRERNVCYLPPIEMMVLGGPVLYFPGSLLHRYFNSPSPGLVNSEEEALRKARLLIKGDAKFVEEVLTSQEVVAERYSKSYGLPIFSRAISEILEKSDASEHSPITASPTQSTHSESKPVLLFAHFAGAYVFSNGEYSTMHGIPRVMRQLVKALTLLNIPVVVTAWRDDLINTHGFYSSHCDNPNLVSVIPVDDLGLGIASPRSGLVVGGVIQNILKRMIQKSSMLRNIHERYVNDQSALSSFELTLIKLYKTIVPMLRKIESALAFLGSKSISLIHRVSALKNNATSRETGYPNSHASLNPGSRGKIWRYVVVPHYYLFPEALTAGFDRVLAYIPDYIPHFFKGRNYFPENNSHLKLGHRLANISTIVLTNSRFTAGYLPNCSLAVPKDKIVSFPMPFLSMSKDGYEDKADYKVVNKLSDKKFIFYPTQPHPNKRLDLLVRSWISINKLRPDLRLELTLTCGDLAPALWDLVRQEELESFLHLFPGISDSTLSWLYKNAICLAFTSELEGNLPTQLLEALQYRCPVVAMGNPLITSELGKMSEKLLTAPFADVESFANCVIYAAENRAEVLKRQESVLDYVKESNSFEMFMENVINLDRRLQQ